MITNGKISTVSLSFGLDQLPPGTTISGQVVIDGGLDARGEENADIVLFSFIDEPVNDVRRRLKPNAVAKVVLTSISFPSRLPAFKLGN